MRKKCERLFFLVLMMTCLFGPQVANGQTEPCLPADKAMSMKQAIEIALANNYSLRSDSLNITITDYKNKELAGRYRPQVNYTSSTEYNIALPSQLLPGSVIGDPSKEVVPVKFGTRYNLKSGVEVTQTIYRKDLLVQIKASGLNTSIAQSRYNLTREELVYQVALTYYSLQTNAELIRTTARDYQNMKDVLAIAKVQFENGVLRKIDYESLKISTANKQSYLNKLQTQYNDQLANFNYLLGLPASTKTIINDSVSRNIQAMEAGDPLLQREDINLSRLLIASKEVEINSIRAEAKPSINSYFRFSNISQFNNPDKFFNSDYWTKSSTVGVSVSVPLFDGRRRKNRVNAAVTQLDQLKLQSTQTIDKANMQWVTASENLRNNQEQLRITEENLGLAEKVFASRKALYTEGVTTLIELLDAERELSQSRNLYIQALADVQSSWVDVHKAKGTLLTEFLNTL